MIPVLPILMLLEADRQRRLKENERFRNETFDPHRFERTMADADSLLFCLKIILGLIVLLMIGEVWAFFF